MSLPLVCAEAALRSSKWVNLLSLLSTLPLDALVLNVGHDGVMS